MSEETEVYRPPTEQELKEIKIGNPRQAGIFRDRVLKFWEDQGKSFEEYLYEYSDDPKVMNAIMNLILNAEKNDAEVELKLAQAEHTRSARAEDVIDLIREQRASAPVPRRIKGRTVENSG